MDKKSPKDISSELTDTFGSKGVVNRVIPDEQLPTDTEGNRAEILGSGTFNPLGIKSVEERGAGTPPVQSSERGQNVLPHYLEPRELRSFMEYLNQTLTDQQKESLCLLGEVVAGVKEDEQIGIAYVTLAVPIYIDHS